MDNNNDIILTKKQKEIFDSFFNEDKLRWILSVGGKGSAKTTVSVYILLTLFFSEEFKGSKILIARESLRDLKNTLVREFKTYLQKLKVPEDEVYEHHEGLQRFKNLLTDTEIYYLSLSSRNDQYRSVLSYEFNVVIIDELDRISESAFDEVSQRMRLKHTFNKGLLNLNPIPETHWIFKKFIANPFPQLKVIQTSTYDNYLIKKIPNRNFTLKAEEYVSPQNTIYYVINNTRYEIIGRDKDDYLIVKEFNVSHPFLVEMEHKSFAFRRVMLEGNWGSYYTDDGLYSQEFTEKHIFTGNITPQDLRLYYRIYGGFDFGVRRPAFVLIAEDEWGRYYIIDELLGENVSSLIFVENIRRRLRERWKLDIYDVDVFGDVAGSFREQGDGLSIISKIREQYNFVIKTQKVKIMESVFKIRSLLEKEIANRPALQVSQECKYTLAGMLGEFKMDEYGKPIKDNYYEHIHDSLRYGLMGALQNNVKNIKIYTPDY
ncbi:MAG: phage terminase large subunit [Brevinematia bacterium]